MSSEQMRRTSGQRLKRVLLGHVFVCVVGMAVAVSSTPSDARAKYRHWRVRKPAEHVIKDPFGDIPSGPLQIIISIKQQKLHLYSDGLHVADAPVATGVPGHLTPLGVFSIIQRDRFHHSNIYSNAPMPYMQRITWSGVALHEGPGVGHQASHGCIRMPHDFAARLWLLHTLGARVIIAQNELHPVDFSDPHLFVHKDLPQTPAAALPNTIETAQAVTPGTKTDAGGSLTLRGPTGTADTPAVKSVTTPRTADGAATAAGSTPPEKVTLPAPPAPAVDAKKAAAADHRSSPMTPDNTAGAAASDTSGTAARTAPAVEPHPAAATVPAPSADRSVAGAADRAVSAFTSTRTAQQAAPTNPAEAAARTAGKAPQSSQSTPTGATPPTSAANPAAPIDPGKAATGTATAKTTTPAQTVPATSANTTTTSGTTPVGTTPATAGTPTVTPVEGGTPGTSASPLQAATGTSGPTAPPANNLTAPVDAPVEQVPLPLVKPAKLAGRAVGAPIAIFISRKEKRIYVRQEFTPVISAPVTIDNPDQPLGTHVFTALNYQPDGSTFRWNVVSFPAGPQKMVREWKYVRDRWGRRYRKAIEVPVGEPQPVETPQEALARIEIPQDVIAQISQLIVPGSSLVISDHGLGRETGRGTDFIVVTR